VDCSAAAAFGATDAALAKTFADLETQMGYYTSTTLAPGTTAITAPSASAQAALNSLSLPSTSSTSFWDTGFGQALKWTGIAVGVVVVAAVVIALLPEELIAAAATAVVGAVATAATAFMSWAFSW
jgi:hypothetical protein